MNKTPYALAMTILVTLLFLPVFSRAQTTTEANDLNGDTRSIRDKIRADIQSHIEDVQNNQDYRNTMFEQRFGSTTSESRADQSTASATEDRPTRQIFMASSTLNSSTSVTVRLHDRNKDQSDRENGGRAMRYNIFEIRKETIVKQLDRALDNLNSVRTRMGARIQNLQSSGRKVNDTLKLLAVADVKLQIAKNSVDAVANIQATSTLDTTSTSSIAATIDLSKPRRIVEQAIRSINDARRALGDVVISIAKDMGYEIDSDGNIITPVPSTATTTNNY